MTATVSGGPRTWSAERDEEGHRTYKVVHLVHADIADGPSTVMQTPGLPAIGSYWNFGGVLNDTDVWAFCYPSMSIRHHKPKEGDPHKYWRVEQTFSTKPLHRCSDTTIEDPLLEPQRISGSFVKYTTNQKFLDKDGAPIKNSSHELVPGVEKDNNRPTVKIGQNVSSLGLSTFSAMVDTLNNATLWGLPARTIKLSNVSWERVLFGSCSFYYVRNFEFDVRFDTFDEVITDEGSMVLKGHHDTNPATGTGVDEGDQTGTGPSGTYTGWVTDAGADASNPQDFIRYPDVHGNPARILLNGAGEPLDDGDSPITQTVQLYTESNFLSLGIPTLL